MRFHLIGLLVCLFIATGCDKPDEVYKDRPDDYDTDLGNGLVQGVSTHYDGEKGWDDETNAYDPVVPTIEVCSDKEIADKQVWMVNQPVIPMVGAGGLDMTGGEDWSGLTIDEAQSPEMLCQALYYQDGIAAWGDYYELIAIFNEQSREIYDILARPGYKGTITAGDYQFEMNEPITFGGKKLDKTDGSDLDPRTDDNMRLIDRAFIKAFRPAIENPDSVDCVDAGSCYIIMSGTEPVLVFMSVSLYIRLEPTEHRIATLEVGVKRPFTMGMGEATVDGVNLTIRGTAAAGIPECEITYGTQWGHIEDKCLANDKIAMAQIQANGTYEYVVGSFGGNTFYFERDLPSTDIIKPEEAAPLQATDTVRIVSINAGYEGNFSMPYSDVLRTFKNNLDASIRAAVGLGPEELTGLETLRTPDDPYLPDEVKARYPDRLRPGGIFAAFCKDIAEPDISDAGVDEHTPEYECFINSDGKPVFPLVNTVRGNVATKLGARITPQLAEGSYYTQAFERSLAEYFNDGPVADNKIIFSPRADRPDLIDATIFIEKGEEKYTVQTLYGTNDDRIHYVSFQNGAYRQEEILMKDADKTAGGVFNFQRLRASPFLGLGAKGTVEMLSHQQDIRHAMLKFNLGGSDVYEVLAPYQPASTVTGYWVPLQGVQEIFHQADWFALSGGTIGAGFYLAPESEGSDTMEVVAIVSGSFFGNLSWCTVPVTIGDSASAVLAEVADRGYPCEMIVRRSENNEFIEAIYDMDSQTGLMIANDMVNKAYAWLR